MNKHWAIILGGSSGLGLATAQKLARTGYNICIVHRTRKSDLDNFKTILDELKANDVQVMAFNKDALLEETIKEVIEALPKQSVKVLVHSIAKGSLKPLLGTQENTLNKQDITITLEAMGYSWYEWTQALVAHNLFAKNSRNIAFTSEGNAKVWTGYAAVSAAKATLEAFMRSMAVEYAPLGMTTNCIQAGATRTPSFDMIPDSEKLAEMTRKRNPFQRLTSAQDVANAVYLLCLEEANWINGTILKVDGGESLR